MLVFGAVAVIVVAAIALSPVSTTAHDVVDRFKSVTNLGQDTSATERQATFSDTLPIAAAGAARATGWAGWGGDEAQAASRCLRAPDNGYLALMYQVGPARLPARRGRARVHPDRRLERRAGARARAGPAPGCCSRCSSSCSCMLAAGDEFYGSHGVILWFIAGQVLAYDFRRRQADESSRTAAIASA